MEVFPVFYIVDPSDIQKQMETFELAFVKHEEHFKENMDNL